MPVRKGDWWYFERTREGLNYPISVRVPVARRRPHPAGDRPRRRPSTGEQVILDENVEAGRPRLPLGRRARRQSRRRRGSRWAPTSTATSATTSPCGPLPARRPSPTNSTTSTTASPGPMDSRHFFYTRVDDADATVAALAPRDRHRPEHRRPRLPGGRRAVLRSSVGRSRDDTMIVVTLGSSMTTEIALRPARPADRPRSTSLEARRHGHRVRRRALHRRRGPGLVAEGHQRRRHGFPPARASVEGGEWRELVPERRARASTASTPSRRSSPSANVTTGAPRVRVVRPGQRRRPLRRRSARALVARRGRRRPSTVVALGQPELRHRATAGRRSPSLVTPRLVADVDVATGEVHRAQAADACSGATTPART